jgi:predicted transposase
VLTIHFDVFILKRVKTIIQVKLLPEAAQRECLLETMRTFNAACDWLAERAVELDLFTHFKLQSACYKIIRSLFGLSAQDICLVCAKVAYAIGRTPRAFNPIGAVIYDLRLLFWSLDATLLSRSGHCPRDSLFLRLSVAANRGNCAGS